MRKNHIGYKILNFFTGGRYLFVSGYGNPPIWCSKVFDIVRSYDEFVNYIESYGIPKVIILENDLKHDLVFDFEYLSGIDCAIWLARYLRNNKLKIDYKKFYIKLQSEDQLLKSHVNDLFSEFIIKK